MVRDRLGVLAFVLCCLMGQALVAADGPASRAAARLVEAMPDWKVHHVDQQPSVSVEGQPGYRVVLRRSFKEPPPGFAYPQSPETIVDRTGFLDRHEDWHFVLVPAGGAKLSPNAKREILWHVPDEKVYRLTVAMGEGDGFAWFSYISIPMQQFLRARLALQGGDDRLELLVRGLAIDDEGTNTRTSVLPVFVNFGADGFAALSKVISSHEPSSPGILPAIHALGFFRDAQATAKLVELQNHWSKEIRGAAAYALAHRPYRREAKAAYFQMISARLRVETGLDACAEFGWSEASPLIEEVIRKPPSLGIYRRAYEVSRQLSDDPLHPDLLAAADIVRRQLYRTGPQPTAIELAQAREKLRSPPAISRDEDIDDRVFIGFTLAIYSSKSSTDAIRQDGLDLLSALPRRSVERMLVPLHDGLEDESGRQEILKLLRSIP